MPGTSLCGGPSSRRGRRPGGVFYLAVFFGEGGGWLGSHHWPAGFSFVKVRRSCFEFLCCITGPKLVRFFLFYFFKIPTEWGYVSEGGGGVWAVWF